MNYRHQFHAGNFADVMKHVLLVQLVRALQQKPKGLLYLDTHAGRGCYDLEASARGDSLARRPEWRDGIGRLWSEPGPDRPVADYAALVRQFNADRGGTATTPRYYPGSPWLVRLLAREQDRLALCEKHPEEQAALEQEFQFATRTRVHPLDGYASIRALLPPPERRALVLVDPPFEMQDEFSAIVPAVAEGLARLPGGVFAIWYPMTERARLDAFFQSLVALGPPPALALELAVAPPSAAPGLRGCGLVVLNPPWRFDALARPTLDALSQSLMQTSGGGSRVEWIVPDR